MRKRRRRRGVREKSDRSRLTSGDLVFRLRLYVRKFNLHGNTMSSPKILITINWNPRTTVGT